MKNIYFTSIFLISIFTFSQDNSKYPSGYIPVKSLTELKGNWKYGSDLLKINTSAKSIQFNDGMKLYLDYAKLPAYNQFYIYIAFSTYSISKNCFMFSKFKIVVI